MGEILAAEPHFQGIQSTFGCKAWYLPNADAIQGFIRGQPKFDAGKKGSFFQLGAQHSDRVQILAQVYCHVLYPTGSDDRCGTNATVVIFGKQKKFSIVAQGAIVDQESVVEIRQGVLF